MSDQIRAELDKLRNQMQFMETAQATLIEQRDALLVTVAGNCVSIEYHATEADKLRRQAVTLIERAERAEGENAELLAGLKVYADPANWECPRCHGKDDLNCGMLRWTGAVGPAEELRDSFELQHGGHGRFTAVALIAKYGAPQC